MRTTLKQRKEQVRLELERNNSLTERASTLAATENENHEVLSKLDDDLGEIRGKLNEYERTTQWQDDQNKFQKAITQLQSEHTDLTELTQLALHITQELNRAKLNATSIS